MNKILIFSLLCLVGLCLANPTLAQIGNNKSLFICKKQTGSSVMCEMNRNKTFFLFSTAKSRRANMHDIEIFAVVNKMSNKVFSSFIVLDTKQAGKVVAKLLYAQKKANGYEWDYSATDVLQATYDLTANTMTFEALGRMKDFLDTKHGFTSEQVKSKLTPPKYDEDNMIKAVTAYFIMEYTKGIKF